MPDGRRFAVAGRAGRDCTALKVFVTPAEDAISARAHADFHFVAEDRSSAAKDGHTAPASDAPGKVSCRRISIRII